MKRAPCWVGKDDFFKACCLVRPGLPREVFDSMWSDFLQRRELRATMRQMTKDIEPRLPANR